MSGEILVGVTGELGGGVAEVSEWRPALVKQWCKHKNMIKDLEGSKIGQLEE